MMLEAQPSLFPHVGEPLDFRLVHYLGSKLRLIQPIRDAVEQVVPFGGRVCDLFAGSGAVSLGLRHAWGIRHVTVSPTLAGTNLRLIGCNAESVVRVGDRTVRAAQAGQIVFWDVVPLPSPPWAPGPQKLVRRARAQEDVAWFANVCQQTLLGLTEAE